MERAGSYCGGAGVFDTSKDSKPRHCILKPKGGMKKNMAQQARVMPGTALFGEAKFGKPSLNILRKRRK